MREPIGEQELALLNDLVSGGPATIAEVAARFGAPRGLARSTVITMMERLRRKGYLGRRRQDGRFLYHSPVALPELLGRLVRGFVERSLGGSVSPFVAYLAEAEDLSAAEIRELEDVVRRLKARQEGE